MDALDGISIASKQPVKKLIIIKISGFIRFIKIIIPVRTVKIAKKNLVV